MSRSRISGRHIGRQTVKSCADEFSGHSGLLPKVQVIRDLRSIRIIGPRLLRRGRHGSEVHEEKGRDLGGRQDRTLGGRDSREEKDLGVGWEEEKGGVAGEV